MSAVFFALTGNGFWLECFSVDVSHLVQMSCTCLQRLCASFHPVIKNGYGACVFHLCVSLQGCVLLFLPSPGIHMSFYVYLCDRTQKYIWMQMIVSDKFRARACVCVISVCSCGNVCCMVTELKPLTLQTCVACPVLWQCRVWCGCRRKAAPFCLCVCVWTCLCVVWSQAEKSLGSHGNKWQDLVICKKDEKKPN